MNKLESDFTSEEKWVIEWIKGKNTIPHNSNDTFYIHSFAKKNGLAPYLYFQLKKHQYDIPTDLEKLLKKEYLTSLLRNTKIQSVWKELNNIFKANQLKAVPLKGIFLSKFIYEDPAHRPMSDIDILFANDQVNKAYDLLLKEGGKILHENEAAHDEKTGHHLPGINYKGVLIEIHKSLFPLDTNYQLPLNEIWPSLMQYKDTITLNPLHNLIYLCLHAYTTMQRGGIRLSWFLDVILLCQSDYIKINIDIFIETISRLKVEQPVIDVLLKTEFVFGYKFNFIPDSYQKSFSEKQKRKFILFIHNSNQQKTNYSYVIAWERFKNTSGIKNKAIFIKSVLLSKRDKGFPSLLKRIGTLTHRTLGMIFKKK